jgi:hypothetical protein
VPSSIESLAAPMFGMIAVMEKGLTERHPRLWAVAWREVEGLACLVDLLVSVKRCGTELARTGPLPGSESFEQFLPGLVQLRFGSAGIIVTSPCSSTETTYRLAP